VDTGIIELTQEPIKACQPRKSRRLKYTNVSAELIGHLKVAGVKLPRKWAAVLTRREFESVDALSRLSKDALADFLFNDVQMPADSRRALESYVATNAVEVQDLKARSSEQVFSPSLREASAIARSSLRSTGGLVQGFSLAVNALEGLITAGQEVPVVGAACTLLKGLLKLVRDAQSTCRDVTTAGGRALDIVDYLNSLPPLLKLLTPTDRNLLLSETEKIMPLVCELTDVVRHYGRPGFILRIARAAFATKPDIIELDARIQKQLLSFRSVLNVAAHTTTLTQIAAISQLLKSRPRNYPLCQAIRNQVRNDDIRDADDVVAAMDVRSLAIAGGVSQEAFKMELDYMKECFDNRFQASDDLLHGYGEELLKGQNSIDHKMSAMQFGLSSLNYDVQTMMGMLQQAINHKSARLQHLRAEHGRTQEELEFFDDDEAALRRASWEVGRGNAVGALMEFTNSSQELAESGEALFAMGSKLKLEGKHMSAINLFRAALEKDPSIVGAWFALGYSLDEVGDRNGAIEVLSNCLELNPLHTSALNNYAILMDGECQNLKTAEIALRSALRTNSSSPRSRTSLLVNHSSLASVHFNLGCLLKEQKQINGAEASFREAIRLNTNHSKAYCHLGALLKIDRKDFEGAEAAYREALRVDPTNASAHLNLGVLLSEATLCTTEAENEYRKCLLLEPTNANALYNLGVLLKQRGEIVNAEICYRRAIHYNPDHANAHWNWSLLLEARGDMKTAVREVKEFVRCKRPGGHGEARLEQLRRGGSKI
jgi:Flp pilus assembly protein TadD